MPAARSCATAAAHGPQQQPDGQQRHGPERQCPPPPLAVQADQAAARPGRGHRELLGREHVVRLLDPARVLGQQDRSVVQHRVGSRHSERLGGEHVVGLVFGMTL